jgi:sugar-specific transcriptional regulator TrmB
MPYVQPGAFIFRIISKFLLLTKAKLVEISGESFVVHDDEYMDTLHSQFEVTSELSVLLKKASESTNTAQKSQYALLDAAGFNVMLSHGKQDIKNALDRGVRVRIITEEPESPKAAFDLFGFEHPLLTVKYVPDPVTICMMLFDDKEVHLRVTKETVPSFWSNNPRIINLSKTYYDQMWNKL